MEQVILIRVESESDLADISPNGNFIVNVVSTNDWYRGNDSGFLIKINDSNSTTFANHFLFS